MGARRRWAVTIGLATVLAAGCVSGEGHDIAVVIRTTTTTSTTTTTTAPTTTTSVVVAVPDTVPFVPAGCKPAAQQDIDVIRSSMVDGASRLGEAFVGVTDGRSYIVADIYDAAGNQLSTADVWLVERSQVFNLSGGARRYTPNLPDAAYLSRPPTERDPVPLLLLSACLIPSLRGR